MQKLILGSCCIIATIILSGCGSTDTSTDSIDTTTGTAMFTVDSCNRYVDVATCMIKNTPDANQAGSQEMLDRTLVEWKKLTSEQLQTNCDAVMKIMTENKDAIKQMGCEVE